MKEDDELSDSEERGKRHPLAPHEGEVDRGGHRPYSSVWLSWVALALNLVDTATDVGTGVALVAAGHPVWGTYVRAQKKN